MIVPCAPAVTCCESDRSPDSRPRARASHHRVAFLAPERLCEFGHVGKWSIDAESPRRVRISLELEPESFITRVRPARLRIRKEEALFRSEAVDQCFRLSLERALECIVSDRNA